MKDSRKELVRRYWSLHEGREMSFHDVMVDMYVTKNMTIRQMAKEMFCSVGIVHRWLTDEGVTGKKIKFL